MDSVKIQSVRKENPLQAALLVGGCFAPKTRSIGGDMLRECQYPVNVKLLLTSPRLE